MLWESISDDGLEFRTPTNKGWLIKIIIPVFMRMGRNVAYNEGREIRLALTHFVDVGHIWPNPVTGEVVKTQYEE